MQIKPTMHLENGALNAQNDINMKICRECAYLKSGDSAKIKEDVARIKDNKNEVENPREKIW